MAHELKQRFLLIIIGLLFVGTTSGQAEESKSNKYSLDDCIALAYQNSETIKSAELGVSKARHGVSEARSGYLPGVTYEAAAVESELDTASGHEAGVSLNQNLYTWGKLSSQLKISQLELEAAEEDLRKAQQTLTYKVKAAFYEMWLANQALRVAQASYDNMDQHYQTTKYKYEAGTVSPYELLQAEVQWKKLKPTLISAKNNLEIARLNLATLVGSNGQEAFDIQAESLANLIPAKPSQSLDEALAVAYRDRPEMRQIQKEIASTKLQTKLKRAEYYPDLTLNGTYGKEKYDSDWGTTWSVTLDLSGTLFDGFSTQAQVAAAKDEEKIQESEAKQLRDDIRLELEQGLKVLEESLETIAANQANIELVQETLRLTKIRLEEGMATTTDLMDAQLDLDEALNGYYEGISDYLIALANWNLMTGKDI